MGEVLKIVVNTKIENVLRVSAINAASNLGGQEALSLVVKLANDINDPCQLEAIGAAVKMDPPEGVKLGIAALEKGLDSEKISKFFDVVASRNGAWT